VIKPETGLGRPSTNIISENQKPNNQSQRVLVQPLPREGRVDRARGLAKHAALGAA